MKRSWPWIWIAVAFLAYLWQFTPLIQSIITKLKLA